MLSWKNIQSKLCLARISTAWHRKVQAGIFELIASKPQAESLKQLSVRSFWKTTWLAQLLKALLKALKCQCSKVTKLAHCLLLLRPCAWFHKPAGCSNGDACAHCHLCPEVGNLSVMLWLLVGVLPAFLLVFLLAGTLMALLMFLRNWICESFSPPEGKKLMFCWNFPTFLPTRPPGQDEIRNRKKLGPQIKAILSIHQQSWNVSSPPSETSFEDQ